MGGRKSFPPETHTAGARMRARGLVLACAMVLGIQLSSAGGGLDSAYAATGVCREMAATARPHHAALRVLRLSGGKSGMVRCVIEVRAEHVQDGETLVVVGGPSELGGWDKSRALEMHSAATGGGWWSASVELPLGEIEFKFATRRGGEWSWEPLPPAMNRRSTVAGYTPTPVFTFEYGDTEPPKDSPARAAGARGQSADSAAATGEKKGLLGMFSKRSRPVKRTKTPDWVKMLGADGDDDEEYEEEVRIEAAPVDATPAKKTPSKLGAAATQSQGRWRGLGTFAIALATFSACRSDASDTAVSPVAVAVGPVRLGNSPDNDEASPKLERLSAELQRKDASAHVAATAEGAARAATGGKCLQRVGGFCKALAFNLLRLLASPVTVPIWVTYYIISTALGLFFRVTGNIHAIVFESNSDHFERVLLRNIHSMDGSMRHMNSSLTSAIKTVDKQMIDVAHLENLWKQEHERYVTAVQDRKAMETKLESSSRELREQLESAEKAAVRGSVEHAIEHMPRAGCP